MANGSLFISKPKFLRYLIANTAVLLVLPSQNGCICQIENTGKEPFVNLNEIVRSEIEGFFGKDFRDSASESRSSRHCFGMRVLTLVSG